MKRVSLLLGLAASAALAQLNYLANPGFESNGTGWTLYKTGTCAATATYTAAAAHSGTKGIQVDVTAVDGNNWDIQLQPPQTWQAEAGKNYHMTFWGKATQSQTFNVTASRGPAAGYSYLTGWSMSLGTAWKQYEVWYTSPATGVDSLRLNLYLGDAVGTYTFDDFVLDTVPSALPTTLTLPAQGAWYTGTYRNLFLEMGYSRQAIDAKVDAAFAQLFFGDSTSEAVYRVVPTDTTIAYIEATGYALTEGMSYGLTIALMMDRQDMFDKLWKFAKTYMQQTSGDPVGYFAWKVYVTAPFTPYDVNPAPDGEEYIVSALLLANQRWGSGQGIYDYQAQADSLLGIMVADHGASMLPLIHPSRKQIVFSPAQVSDPYTDPSYHLPAFYRMWAAFASSNNALFTEMADTSWALLKRAENATTGLFPEYSSFDGIAQTTTFNAKSHTFASDAHRVASNIGFSYAWFLDDAWAVTHTKKQLGFFASQSGGYKAEYTLDGTAQVAYSSNSIISCNAAAVLASDRASDWAFVDALWKTPMSSGTYRYYNGLLQMLSLLHVSGKFVAFGSPGNPTGYSTSVTATGVPSAVPVMRAKRSPNSSYVMVTGSSVRVAGLGEGRRVRLLDLQGKVISSTVSNAGAATLVAPRTGAWIVDMGAAGRQSIVVH